MEHDFKTYPELTNKQMDELQFLSPHKQITEDFDATVVKVHDGDTITLLTDFRDFRFPLRLLDIDSPEMNAGGEVARDWLKGRILGENVRITINRNNRVDKYGRLLGKVLHAGLDIGEEELRLGLCTTFENRRETEFPKLDKMFSLKQWF
jgi:endonuclease YncB( thermonuclease family)